MPSLIFLNLFDMAYPFTSIPIDRALPSMRSMAFSMSLALRSFILVSAIWRTFALVTEPAKSRPGVLEPLDSFAAFLRKYDAGGVFIRKVKDLSENTVMV